MRDDLSVVDGVIVKGKAIFIPKMLRVEWKSKLHSSHLGYDSMMRRARNTIFWHGYQIIATFYFENIKSNLVPQIYTIIMLL
jgi:hypothetical protein